MTNTPQLRALFFDVFGTCVRRSAPKVLNMPRLFSDSVRPERSGGLRYLDNALKYRVKAPIKPSKPPLKGALRAFFCKVIIRKRFLACSGHLVPTSVAQRTPVADELWRAAGEVLESDVSSISNKVRTKATKMSYEQWFEFGGEWNKGGDKFVRGSIANHGTVDWRAVDKHRLELLPKLLAHRGLVVPHEDASTSELQVGEGSLWDESQLRHLGLVWHRLTPWPDTCRGLALLNRRFSTVTLSNSYNDLLEYLVAHSSIPFTRIYSADMSRSFKPSPEVYLGAAERMGVKPEECGLVAAHLGDLKGAKACGFYAIYVERPLEEKNPELREENILDMWVKEDEEGFVTLAERLGIQVG